MWEQVPGKTVSLEVLGQIQRLEGRRGGRPAWFPTGLFVRPVPRAR